MHDRKIRDTHGIPVELTAEDREQLERLAAQAGLSIEAYLLMLFRRAIHKARGHRRPKGPR